MTHPTVIKLHDGNLMPQLGLGVWKAGNEEVVSAIHKALEVGYRSFDTAAVYQNETGVGNALSSAGVARDELFVTTKLWNDDQKQPREALQESLKKLKLDYVDLYLIHWPVPATNHYVDAWKSLIELQQQGLAKSIGVCNFQVHHLQKIIDETGVAPLRAFISNGRQGVNYHRNVWHHPLFAWQSETDFLTVDRGGKDNCDVVEIPTVELSFA